MTTKPSVILFDCDGVMCPPMRFAKGLAESHDITTTMTHEFFVNDFVACLLGKVDIAQVLPPFLEQWNWQGSVNSFLDLWLASECDVYPEMKTTVSALRSQGFRVGLATNQELRRAAYMRSHMDFGSLFDELFISSELGAMKPQREYFRVVTESLGVPPQSILFIDDQSRCIEAASAYGWNGIRFESYADMLSRLKHLFKLEEFPSI